MLSMFGFGILGIQVSSSLEIWGHLDWEEYEKKKYQKLLEKA